MSEGGDGADAPAPERVAVFLDYQNVLQTGHGLYGRGREVHQCVPEPSLIADLIASRRNVPSVATEIRVYRGRPNPVHESTLAGSNDRQAAQWERRDPRVKMIRRPLVYRDWPTLPPTEKGIDVALAIDLVQYQLAGSHDVLVVFSGDTDLMPAVSFCFDTPGRPVIEVAAWKGHRPLQFADRIGGKDLPWCHYLSAEDWKRVIRDWSGR